MFTFNKIKDIVAVNGIKRISGVIRMDGDKSISHRAVIFASLASGISKIKNCLFSEDVISTINCFRDMGIRIYGDNKSLTVWGKGRFGLKKPSGVLDAGNSGTTIRLLSGILAGQNFESKIKGDKSLAKRPMARVVLPLRKMGARIEGRKKGDNIYPPLSIKGDCPLKTIHWKSKISSAQVKSAVLLAGIYAKKGVSLSEPVLSRDHTERMMKALSLPIKAGSNRISLGKSGEFGGKVFSIPGDISSSAFFVALSLMLKDSVIKITEVGLNRTRTGFIELLKMMGADIEWQATGEVNCEPVGYIIARSSGLKAVKIKKDMIPSLIDEIPIIAVLATQSAGKTVISGAGELRVKESDRLKNIASELKKMNADIQETPDGLIINGPSELKPARLNGFDDHRIVMSLAVASLLAAGKSEISTSSSVKISCPGFWRIMKEIAQ